MNNIKKTVIEIIASFLLACLLFSCVTAKTKSGGEISVGTGSETVTNEEATTEEPTQSVAPIDEDTTSESGENTSDASPGAATYDELVAVVCDGYRFTEQKVNCMGQEFLFACLYACDPENAAALFEERDCAGIASLLNDRFFTAIGEKPFKYSIISHTDLEMTDEAREEVQNFFMSNRQSVVEQCGEYYFMKVSEENEGREMMILLNYVKTDEDGNETSVSEDADDELVFNVINGRYYWSDFTLFASIADNY